MTTVDRYRKTTSEAQMRDTIAEVVALQGGRMFWIPRSDLAPAMTDWPDLVILLPPRVIFCELKSQKRAVTAGQSILTAMLTECDTIATFVVRPAPKDGETSYDAFLTWLGDPA